MPSINGGTLIADILAAEGISTVFGIPDGTYLGLMNALDGHGIRLVTPWHETTALHMAGAYGPTPVNPLSNKALIVAIAAGLLPGS